AGKILVSCNEPLRMYYHTSSPFSQIYSKQETELGVPNTLICFVNDFHPPFVDITWTKNGQLVDRSEISQTQYYSNSDFSFRTMSYLNFTPQENDIYTCSVHHIRNKVKKTAWFSPKQARKSTFTHL
uniref:Ig-like domain-containing protein n=1 Tax=Acanthochromis polyacanthus TaxID=80966 RepID=A0A3Q1HXC2_9TELE